MNNKEVLGLNKITKARLKELCKKNKLYQTPYINDQLYLHYQGFEAIENLEEYTGLKCLWLESNAISEIQGLECQPELKCLFLQNNLIKKIENLQSCLLLDTLNLASNHITRVENCGVDVLPVLSTLNLSRNYLRNSEALRELVNCRNLWSLDLSHNRIDDILVVKIFANMPELRVLVLQGNPVVSQVPQYRKTLILECKNLTYLDSRPVFPKDRACAEAWKRGGYEEERRENDRWVREDRKKIRDSVNATLRLRQKQGGGDVQLLESTDDEEENSKPTKLKKIPEEIVSADLEITGVNTASKNEDIKPCVELRTSESSLSDSSDCEGSILKYADGLEEEPKAIEIEATAGIQMQPIREQVIQDRSSIQTQYFEAQLEVPVENSEEKDLCISGDAINLSKATNWHDEETKFEIDPKSATTNQSISDTNPSTAWNESTTSLTTDLTIYSDLSSRSGLSIYGDADAIDIPGNTDNVLEYLPSEECSKEEADIQTKSEEDKDILTEDVLLLTQKLTFNISSESQFADSELSPHRPSISEEEAIQTCEIGTQEEIPLQHTTFSELLSLSPTTLGTDLNLSELDDSSFENTKLVSDVEDSGLFNIFNSADASERILTSDDESGGLPDLESAMPNEEQDHSKTSIWQDIILTELRKNEANGANEFTDETTDKFELDIDSSSQSEMIASNKTNTLSSSLFVENSDEEKAMRDTLDELDASTWQDQILENSLETSSQEAFLEKIEEDVSRENTEDETFGVKNSSEMSYQSDGSSLLEYILSNEKEPDKSSLEMLSEDATLYDRISQQSNSIQNEEDMSSSEELTQLRYWHEKDAAMALGERVSLENLLATLEEKEEDKFSSSEFNKRRVQLEQWLGEHESEVEDEDEDMTEKQEHIYKQSVEDDEETLSLMYNKELGQNEDKAFEEADMLESILKQIEEEEEDQRFTSNEDLENIEKWFGEGKDKSLSEISEGSGHQNSFSCSSPYEEVFDNKHFSLMPTNEDCNISKEGAEVLKDISEVSTWAGGVLTRPILDEKTVPLGELDSDLADNMSSNDSWWEKTLAAARERSEPPKVPTDDESFEETIKQAQTLQEQVEASALLERILTTTHEKQIEICPNQTVAAELPSNESNEESKPTTTIHDVLSSFNKVAENIATTRYLNTYALATKDFSTQSSDQINRQVEEMNREQRERVSQMIDRVYAQKDKYNDNLEVVDGRLMIVKRSTGELEELPLPPTSPSKYSSCGVSTTPGNCNDSYSDDYGTALSEDEPDDDDDSDIEQHASDTKIKKIPYLSGVYGNESSKSTGMGLEEVEDNCHRESNEHEFDSKHIVMELGNEIDTVVCTKWLKKGAAGPAGRLTTVKANGEEKALLLRKLCGGTTELQTDLSCRCCQHMDVDDGAALRDVALMFEPSEGAD